MRCDHIKRIAAAGDLDKAWEQVERELRQADERIVKLEQDVQKWVNREAALANREIQRESDLLGAHQQLAAVEELLVSERETSVRLAERIAGPTLSQAMAEVLADELEGLLRRDTVEGRQRTLRDVFIEVVLGLNDRG